jgi:hypothetical protein
VANKDLSAREWRGAQSADGLTGKPNMINRTLARRLEDLEAEFLPVAGETKIIRVNFVERDGTVVDHSDFTVNGTAPNNPAGGRDHGGDECSGETARAA